MREALLGRILALATGHKNGGMFAPRRGSLSNRGIDLSQGTGRGSTNDVGFVVKSRLQRRNRRSCRRSGLPEQVGRKGALARFWVGTECLDDHFQAVGLGRVKPD